MRRKRSYDGAADDAPIGNAWQMAAFTLMRHVVEWGDEARDRLGLRYQFMPTRMTFQYGAEKFLIEVGDVSYAVDPGDSLWRLLPTEIVLTYQYVHALCVYVLDVDEGGPELRPTPVFLAGETPGKPGTLRLDVRWWDPDEPFSWPISQQIVGVETPRPEMNRVVLADYTFLHEVDYRRKLASNAPEFGVLFDWLVENGRVSVEPGNEWVPGRATRGT